MKYEIKTAKDYDKLSEWLLIKITGKLKVAKDEISWLSSVLADEYNLGWDDCLKNSSSYRKAK